MKKFIYVTATACLITAAVNARDSLNITVKAGALQRYGGVGIHKTSFRYRPNMRDTIAALIIKELDINHVRIFFSGESPEYMLDGFYNSMNWNEEGDTVTVYDDFLKQNPDLFFIAGFTDKDLDTKEKIKATVRKNAIFLKMLTDRENMNIRWAGLTNEPQDGPKVPIDLYPFMVSEFRRYLDSVGLQKINIYIPEVSNVDHRCEAYIDSVMNDQAAWEATEGFQTKSYNMSANWYMKKTVEKTKKPYFVAAGCNLLLFPHSGKSYNPEVTTTNDHYAADLAGRILNDFNHMASYWAFYLGAEYWYKWENAHRLIIVFQNTIDKIEQENLVSLDDSTHLLITLKYHYYKHLSKTFDVGGKFRYCEADRKLPDYDMVYTFGQKPAINAAACQNPDSTWAIAVTNLTGCMSDTIDSCDWHPQTLFTYYPADTFDVTFRVKELANQPAMNFTVYRSSKIKRMEKQEAIVAKRGKFTVKIGPKELVTLQSTEKPIDVIPIKQNNAATIDAASISVKNHSLIIKTSCAGFWKVKLFSISGREITATSFQTKSASSVVLRDRLFPGMYICSVDRKGMRKKQTILVH